VFYLETEAIYGAFKDVSTGVAWYVRSHLIIPAYDGSFSTQQQYLIQCGAAASFYNLFIQDVVADTATGDLMIVESSPATANVYAIFGRMEPMGGVPMRIVNGFVKLLVLKENGTILNIGGTLERIGSTDLAAYSTTAEIAAAYQPINTNLTDIAALTTTSYGRSLLTGADASATRTTLGLGTAATAASTSFVGLNGGQVITSATASTVALTHRLAASQTANAIEIRNVSNTLIQWINSAGGYENDSQVAGATLMNLRRAGVSRFSVADDGGITGVYFNATAAFRATAFNCYFGVASSSRIIVTSVGLEFYSGSNTLVGGARAAGFLAGTASLATNATAGFCYIPTCAGIPTGTPTAVTGYAPLVIDSTNNKLYFYSGGAWRDAGP
jgi:hypothetical protein